MEERLEESTETLESVKAELEKERAEKAELKAAHDKLKDDFIALSLCKEKEATSNAKQDEFTEYFKIRFGK